MSNGCGMYLLSRLFLLIYMKKSVICVVNKDVLSTIQVLLIFPPKSIIVFYCFLSRFSIKNPDKSVLGGNCSKVIYILVSPNLL
jgi:hypothetical protein